MFKKVISMLTIIVNVLILNYPIFANSALENAKSVISSPSTFDGASHSYKSTLPEPKTSISQRVNNTSQQEEPTFMDKLAQDIKDNKATYITTLGAAGFLGLLLGGPIGALVGIGAMFAFTVTQRADYIDTFVKPKK
ncbi:MAG: hypothetical protein N2Z20_01365 [Elusimicrobiales bacterium]|nr:hypothetical protein [Elusimicrobiales bacterium]